MADYKMLAEMGVPMPPPENLIMDEDLKLARDLGGVANLLAHRRSTGDNVVKAGTDQAITVCREAAATITRLHATITQMTNTIDGLEFQLNEARAEIKALKPGSHEAVEAGCTCPVIENNYGQGVSVSPSANSLLIQPRAVSFWYLTGCPMHGCPVIGKPAHG